MTVSVNITGLEPIAAAINSLAQAMGAKGVTAAVAERKKGEAHQPAPVPAPQPGPIPAVPAQPVQSVPAAAAQAVPTTTKTYTVDELSNAAMGLMDAGRQNDLIGLLQQFGVSSLPYLPPEQYGAFATALRGMGAQI